LAMVFFIQKYENMWIKLNKNEKYEQNEKIWKIT
jgi:hypothetical protein